MNEKHVPCNYQFVQVEGDQEIWECPECHQRIIRPKEEVHYYSLQEVNTTEKEVSIMSDCKELDYDNYEDENQHEFKGGKHR